MITPAIILMRPSALLWALAAGAVVVLYLRAIRPPRVVTARPNVWQEVLGEPRSSAVAWRRRRLISAAIHASIVFLLALAAADPCVQRPRTVVFVVDNSRSMEAVVGGSSRLARVKESLKEHLETIGPREYAALITTAGQPVVISAAEQNLDRISHAIERIQAVDLPSQMVGAIERASGLVAKGTRLEVCVFSDGLFSGADSEDMGQDVVRIAVGGSEGNAGATRLAVRRYPNDSSKFQAIVEITNCSDKALTAPLRVMLNDKTIHESTCEVGADSTATNTTDLESESGGPVSAVLDHSDSLADDNRLEVVLPAGGAERAVLCPEAEIAVQEVCKIHSPAGWSGEPPAPTQYAVLPLWPWFVLAAFVLLATEWALYHRRWTS